VSKREALFGILHLASFAALIALVALLIAGRIEARSALPFLVGVVIALEAFRYLGRKERKRREAVNG
jgi:hypothetical protein